MNINWKHIALYKQQISRSINKTSNTEKGKAHTSSVVNIQYSIKKIVIKKNSFPPILGIMCNYRVWS